MNAVAYYRVSTRGQVESGLGLDAQRAAVQRYAARTGARVLAVYEEQEDATLSARARRASMSGSRDDRPGLRAALDHARAANAVLVIAALDRLSRNAAFLLALRDSGVDLVCCDMPDANRLTIGVLAVMAEHERDAISRRTKAALASLKARGAKLGNPQGAACLRAHREAALAAAHAAQRANLTQWADRVRPMVQALLAEGRSAADVAVELEARGVRRARGGSAWTREAVQSLTRD